QLQNIFTQEAFASAKSLTGLSGIRHMKGKSQITWVHFACDQHEVVRANGCWTESLLLGPMVVNGLSPAERQALANIFGRRPTPNKILNGPPARSYLSVSAVKQQCLKHLSNKRRPTTKTPRTSDYDHTIKDAIRHTAAIPPLVHAKALCSQHQN
ncbi:MAG: Hint domain-containing protein, partial [Alphaproteobacteria bacterium]|nr:Hint domain-containing protein [Alphaproteobacteria bacterium]